MLKSAEHENSKSYLNNPKHFAKVFVAYKVFFSSIFFSKKYHVKYYAFYQYHIFFGYKMGVYHSKITANIKNGVS